MPKEPTTLTSVGKLIAEVLKNHYGVDPEPLFQRVGLDTSLMSDANARYPRAKLMELWEVAAGATGDPCIGLVVGFEVRTTSFHALGYSWLASRTLQGALIRLSRYYRIIVTVPLHVELRSDAAGYELEVVYPDPRYPAPPIALDSFLASIVKLCRTATTEATSPREVWIDHDDNGHTDEYVRKFGAPVRFDMGHNILFFDKEVLDTPIPGDNLDLVVANDKVVERYIESLDPERVATEVRKLLIDLLPTGTASQKSVAQRLNKSVSTLQRQLNTEGTTFREIQDDTRQELAEEYVADGKHSLSQIAYLLGFSDQSNFSRAFKRWNGATPSEYLSDRDNSINPP
jgi:AraC-like DNA-binding protein